ncbi:MAG: prolipoprotein diacylglyceryl transferase family protein [Myxococcota bacterium]
MSGLALPYVQAPAWPVELPLLGSHTISVFGPLVAIGVVVGYRLSLRLADRRGLPIEHADRLAVWVAIGGFAMAHWFSVLLYFPEQVRDDPWILIHFTRGISSMGGFLGGTLTFLWLTKRWRLRRAAYADVLAYGLLAGFGIGRIGCALVHDHPGAPSSAWAAVGPWPDGTTRWDLGLVELALLVPLAAFVYRRDWARARPGLLTVFVAAAYALLRFPLDFLRAEDARYGWLTPAQYACLAVAVVATLAWYAVRTGAVDPSTSSRSAPG